MIERRIITSLIEHLRQFPAVGLLGPRQVGKTTLARLHSVELAGGKAIDYLDLENPVDLQKLQDPVGYLQQRQDRLVILDEVQRLPDLFQVLRGIIDDRVLDHQPVGHFLLLGSTSSRAAWPSMARQSPDISIYWWICYW